jgi:hypothetical protein
LATNRFKHLAQDNLRGFLLSRVRVATV